MFSKKKLEVFLYSLFSNLSINLIGQLYIGQLFAFVNVLSPKKWISLYKRHFLYKRIILAILIFLTAQIISDLYNSTSYIDSFRGLANIAMGLIVFIFLGNVFKDKPAIIIIYFFGEILSIVIFGSKVDAPALDNMGFFKFTLAPLLNNVVLIISWFLLKNRIKTGALVWAIFLVYGIFNFAFDFRSNGAIMVLISLVILTRRFITDLSSKKLLLYFSIYVVVFFGMYTFYVTNVLSGDFGGTHSRQQLVKVENPYNPVNLILYGRAEIIGATAAIADKPIFGHGSWAKDETSKYTLMVWKNKVTQDKLSQFSNYASDNSFLIPTHSVISGAWVTAGIGGFIGIVYLFIIYIRLSIYLIKSRNVVRSSLYPIVLFFILNGIWTFLFSPLGHFKESIPLYLAFLVTIFYESKLNKLK